MREDKRFDDNSKVIKFPKKKRQKKKAGTKILYIVLILILIFLLYKFTGASSFDSTNKVNTEPISLVNANNYDFSSYKDGYVLAKDGKITCYNTNQTVQWEIKGSKTTPKVIVNGNYALVYYTDDSVAVLTNGSKTVNIKTPGNVQHGYVNSNGYSVLLVDEFGLKNKLVVYDKKGKMIYYRDNPDKFIPQILFSNDNKTLATIELITNGSSVSSCIVFTNVKSNKEISRVTFETSIPGGCIFTDSKTLLTIFDSELRSYNVNGKLNWKNEFKGKTLYKYSYDDKILACIFNTDDSAVSGSEVVFYNTRGNVKSKFDTEHKLQNIKFKKNSALLTFDKSMILTNLKGKEISHADITYDTKETHLMGTKKCALLISNSQTAKLLPLE